MYDTPAPFPVLDEEEPTLPPVEPDEALVPPGVRSGLAVLAALLAFGVSLLVVLAVTA